MIKKRPFTTAVVSFFVIVCSSIHLWSSSIRHCDSIEAVLEEITAESVSSSPASALPYQGTLVIFDIDNTIFRPTQSFGSDEWFYAFLDKSLQENPHEPFLAKQHVIELWHAIQNITPVIPMEGARTAFTIRAAQQLAPTIALTTRSHQIAATTIRQLNSLDVDFTSSAPVSTEQWIPGAKDALYLKGVLFTSAQSKGIALTQLIKSLGYIPKRIIFINDKETHLKDASFVEQELGVDFIGLRYTAADELQKNFNYEATCRDFERFVQFFHINNEAVSREGEDLVQEQKKEAA